MKRKKVKFFNGKKEVSIWRITFVKIGYKPFDIDCIVLPSGQILSDSESVANNFMTYIVFGVDYPDALKHLSFVSKHVWKVFNFERFRDLDYKAIYQV